MKDSRKKILKTVYDCEQSTGHPRLIELSGNGTINEQYALQRDIQFLLDSGYLQEEVPMSSGYYLAITEKGERLVENDFIMPDEISNITPNNIFNIENATNSVIGTQSNVTLNINNVIQEAKEQINSNNSSDKAELQEIINLLEMVIDNQIPVKKGLLSKFSDIIQRNSWITSPIASILINWMTIQ